MIFSAFYLIQQFRPQPQRVAKQDASPRHYPCCASQAGRYPVDFVWRGRQASLLWEEARCA